MPSLKDSLFNNNNGGFEDKENREKNKSSFSNSRMDKKLLSFCSKYRESKDGFYTHTSQWGFLGKFRFDDENIEDFWKTYCDSVDEGNLVSGLAEIPGESFPVIVDVDFKFTKDEYKDIFGHEFRKDVPIYTQEDVKIMIKVYCEVFKEILVRYKDSDFIPFVLEKPHPRMDEEFIKSSFHLHFLYVPLKLTEQYAILDPRVRDKLRKTSIFKKLNLDDPAKPIDKTNKKPWLLYGAKKGENKMSFELTHTYSYSSSTGMINEITFEEALKNYRLSTIEGDVIKITSKNLKYHLPRILSIRYNYAQQKDVKNNIDLSITKKQMKSKKEIFNKLEDLNIDQRFNICKSLVPMLSAERADGYESWMSVGWALYTIGEGSSEFMDLWLDFSSRTTKGNFSADKCIYEWDHMQARTKNPLANLRYIAKLDNPQKYEEYKKSQSKNKLMGCIYGEHNKLAKLLYENYGEHFACADLEKDVWFMYENHRWKLSKKGIDLRKKISGELHAMFKNLSIELSNKKVDLYHGNEEEDKDNTDKIMEKHLETEMKALSKLLKDLNKANFKDSVMKECREVFYKDEFSKKLDCNPYLLGFENGVYDLKEMKFREGRQDDFISLCTGYDYKNFKKGDSSVISVEEFLEKIFPDEDLRKYFKEYLAGLLVGRNKKKKFLVLSGVGDNGKSVTIELIESMLGKYSKKLPTSLIVGKRTQSSSASPELAQTPGVRFVVLQEPSGKDVVNVGVLKELSGNDTFYARGLFKDPMEITPQFKIALICNKLPKLPSDDPATWERIRVLYFESRFLHFSKCPKTVEEQYTKKIFPRDESLNEKFDGMKQAFMWVALEELKRIRIEGSMPDPYKVINATQKYQNNNNVFLLYVTDCIIKDDECVVPLSVLYGSFKEWFRTNFPGQQVPNQSDFKEDIINRWGEPTYYGNKWQGYRIRQDDDDVKEGKLLIINTEKKEESIKNVEKEEERKEERKEEKKERVQTEYEDKIEHKSEEKITIVKLPKKASKKSPEKESPVVSLLHKKVKKRESSI